MEPKHEILVPASLFLRRRHPLRVQALRFLLDGRAAIPDEPADRARLADTLQGELDLLTEKIESLRSSRDLLATIVADVRGDVVGPGHPGDPGGAVARRSVRKAGPALGLAR